MLLSTELENYVIAHNEEEPQLLKALRKETYQKTTQPNMLSGALQGRVLSILSKIISPKVILEIGTFTGYATLCLAEGLSEKGKIITIDRNEEIAYIPKRYFSESEYSSKIDFVIGNALEVISKLEESIDLVFLDADKENYENYVDLVKPKLKKGGIILADNVLWKTKVASDAKDKKTQVIRDFNTKIKQDTSLEVVILPIRDGISIIRKK